MGPRSRLLAFPWLPATALFSSARFVFFILSRLIDLQGTITSGDYHLGGSLISELDSAAQVAYDDLAAVYTGCAEKLKALACSLVMPKCDSSGSYSLVCADRCALLASGALLLF